MNLNAYADHLDTLRRRFDHALAATDFDQVVLSAGDKVTIPDDDQTYPYSPRAFAQQWLPYEPAPGTLIIYRPGHRPVLIWPSRADFWHLSPAEPSGEWTRHWEIQAAESPFSWIRVRLNGLYTAWVGPDPGLDASSIVLEPAAVMTRLRFERAWKTGFELDCMVAATELGVGGHLAAANAFRLRDSEAGIYREFLRASRQLESTEPYPGIVALNDAAATLHYERRRFDPPGEHRTLLIDAGARVNGYASDITRTHTTSSGRFEALRAAVAALSGRLVQQAMPGVSMPELHRRAVSGIADILYTHEICRLPASEQVEKGIPGVFFPHGLGHLLGLQVHDTGGHQQDESGITVPDPDYPALRLTRTLSAGMVLTIEPGLYFIPMLLRRMDQDIPDHGVDMALVEELAPWGGVRWEDNILITESGSRNLTAEAFALLDQP